MTGFSIKRHTGLKSEKNEDAGTTSLKFIKNFAGNLESAIFCLILGKILKVMVWSAYSRIRNEYINTQACQASMLELFAEIVND